MTQTSHVTACACLTKFGTRVAEDAAQEILYKTPRGWFGATSLICSFPHSQSDVKSCAVLFGYPGFSPVAFPATASMLAEVEEAVEKPLEI